VATPLLHGSVGLPNFTEEAIHDPKVNAITANTKLVELPDDGGPRKMGVTLTVKMKDGKEYTEARAPRREWVKNPTLRDEIIAKFWHQVDFSQTVSRKNAQQILDLVVKNPDQKWGLLLKKKPNMLGGSGPKPKLAIHPRAQHGAFWLFHVNRAEKGDLCQKLRK